MTWTERARGIVTVLAWAGLLVGAIIVLGAMGRGVLSTPPVTGGVAAVRSWASTRDAATILMTGVRVGGRLLAAYLLGSTALGTAARVTRWAAAVRIANAIALPPMRRLAAGTAGLLVVAGPIVPAVRPSGFAPARDRPGAALPAGISAAPALSGATAPPDHLGAGQSAPRGASVAPEFVANAIRSPALDGTESPVLDAIEAPVLEAGGPTSAPPGPANRGHFDTGDWPTLGLLPSVSASSTPETWTVRPGDSLWVLSQSVLHSKWGRAPTDEETGRYWMVVVAINIPRLSDPANPSLLFPGQQMAVPPPPPVPAP